MNRIYFSISGLVAALIACQASSTPPTQPAPLDTPSFQSSPSSTTDCSMIFASYDLPHAATNIGGKELYDLAATEPSDTYLSVSATVVEAQHLVGANNTDGTLIFAYISDLNVDIVTTHVLLIYLPDGGEAVSLLPVDSKISASGLYVGNVYPDKNLFTVFPNEEENTKFPSIKAETASYGCPQIGH